MDLDITLRILLAIILFIGFGISGYYRRLAARAAPGAHRRDESPALKLLRVFVALPAFVVLLGDLLAPRYFAWASFDELVSRIAGEL